MIDRDRIVAEFTRLTAIDSPSFSEREMADVLKAKLRELGFEASEDDAGARIGGNAGNIHAFLKGDLPGKPLLFSSHMDTVDPGIGKRAVTDSDGVIRSAGDTVLGADDVSGICAFLEAVRHLQEERTPHRDIEVLFTVAEEKYGLGAAAFDYGKIKAEEAYVLDLSGAIGTAAVKAPTIASFRAVFQGKSAHAGFAPKDGINAIAAAARAVSLVEQGEREAGGTVNIGTISGGTADNIVSDSCVVTGEVRCFDHGTAVDILAEIKALFEQNACGTKVEFETRYNVIAYETAAEHEVVGRFLSACKAAGLKGDLVSTFGGSDNNVFMQKGITGIVLACGMHEVHTVNEYTSADDLVKTARLTAELIKG